ncbi:DUF4145 domain-containing protein [Actinosynnema sp. NPDC051121]
MLSRVCWKCKTKSRMDAVSDLFSERVRSVGDDRYIIQAAFSCQNCGTLSIGFSVWHSDASRDQSRNFDEYFGPSAKWLPEYGYAQEFPDVPEHIASAAEEAHRCHSIGASRAAVQLARAVVEASAKAVGVTVNGIYPKIEGLHNEGIIREHIKEAAHEIRFLGNDMAHGDFVEPIAAEEVELVLTLMGELLAEVFQSPARVARAREARLAKKKNGG